MAKAQVKKKILYTYHDGGGVLINATETGREFSVRSAMRRLVYEGFAPMGGYDIGRKLIYNWSDDHGTEAFIL